MSSIRSPPSAHVGQSGETGQAILIRCETGQAPLPAPPTNYQQADGLNTACNRQKDLMPGGRDHESAAVFMPFRAQEISIREALYGTNTYPEPYHRDGNAVKRQFHDLRVSWVSKSVIAKQEIIKLMLRLKTILS